MMKATGKLAGLTAMSIKVNRGKNCVVDRVEDKA